MVGSPPKSLRIQSFFSLATEHMIRVVDINVSNRLLSIQQMGDDKLEVGLCTWFGVRTWVMFDARNGCFLISYEFQTILELEALESIWLNKFYIHSKKEKIRTCSIIPTSRCFLRRNHQTKWTTAPRGTFAWQLS